MKMVKEQNIYPMTSWSLTVSTSSRAKRKYGIFCKSVKYISHNTPCLPIKILLNLCFSFLVGITAVPREIENNASAKFWAANKVHLGRFCKSVKYISHNTPCLPTKILLNLCFSFLVGITAVPREIENNASAKFWAANKVHLGRCASGECNC